MGRFTGGVDFVEPAALDARRRIVAFFGRHLGDGAGRVSASTAPPMAGPAQPGS